MIRDLLEQKTIVGQYSQAPHRVVNLTIRRLLISRDRSPLVLPSAVSFCKRFIEDYSRFVKRTFPPIAIRKFRPRGSHFLHIPADS